jgi:hypothetical protein
MQSFSNHYRCLFIHIIHFPHLVFRPNVIRSHLRGHVCLYIINCYKLSYHYPIISYDATYLNHSKHIPFFFSYFFSFEVHPVISPSANERNYGFSFCLGCKHLLCYFSCCLEYDFNLLWSC